MFGIKKFDFYLFLPAIFLLVISVGIIVSISSVSLPNYLLYILASLIFFFFFSFFDIEILFPLSFFLYLFSLLFLVSPLIFGAVIRGSSRWISLAGFTLQPSELVKPFLALAAACFWTEKDFSFKTLSIFSLVFLPSLILIFFQPDLGSTLVVLSIFVGVLSFLKINRKQVLSLLGVLFVVFSLSFIFLKDYQKLRLVHFLNPSLDPLGQGYNLIQAKIAVGSGMFLGKGFGRGTQSHLYFLPERHTDFIFASLAEELGFAGSAIVLLLYLFLLIRILKIAQNQKEKTNFLLCMSLFFYLSFQTVVNIGMNIGLLPITGITLPLMSYGGSSLLSSMISLGILESLSRKQYQEEVIEIK